MRRLFILGMLFTVLAFGTEIRAGIFGRVFGGGGCPGGVCTPASAGFGGGSLMGMGACPGGVCTPAGGGFGGALPSSLAVLPSVPVVVSQPSTAQVYGGGGGCYSSPAAVSTYSGGGCYSAQASSATSAPSVYGGGGCYSAQSVSSNQTVYPSPQSMYKPLIQQQHMRATVVSKAPERIPYAVPGPVMGSYETPPRIPDVVPGKRRVVRLKDTTVLSEVSDPSKPIRVPVTPLRVGVDYSDLGRMSSAHTELHYGSMLGY